MCQVEDCVVIISAQFFDQLFEDAQIRQDFIFFQRKHVVHQFEGMVEVDAGDAGHDVLEAGGGHAAYLRIGEFFLHVSYKGRSLKDVSHPAEIYEQNPFHTGTGSSIALNLLTNCSMPSIMKRDSR